MNINDKVLELYNELYAAQKAGKATAQEAGLLRQLSSFLTKQGYRKQMESARKEAKSNVPTLDPLKGKKIETFVPEEKVGHVDPFEAAKNYEAKGGFKDGVKPELEEVVEEPEESEEGNVLGTSEDKPKRTTRKKVQK